MCETYNKWSDSKDKFHNFILPKLKNHGKEIGELAKSGNSSAKLVMEYYSMLHRSFDPMTLILLEENLDNVLKELQN